MNRVLEYAREVEPAFRDVPDDKLTLFIGEQHPEFLEVPEFRANFEARRQQDTNLKAGAGAQRPGAVVSDALDLPGWKSAIVDGGVGDWLKAAGQGALGMQRATMRPILAAGEAAGDALNWVGKNLAGDVRNVVGTTSLDPQGPMAKGLEDAAKTVPVIAGASALAYAGVPVPVAFALPAGASALAETGDPAAAMQSATTAAVIPGVLNAGKLATAKVMSKLVERGLMKAEEVGTQKAAEILGGQGAVQAFMEGMNLPAYAAMTPEERRDAIQRSIVANTAFLAMDVPTLRRSVPSETQAALPDSVKLASLLRDFAKDPEVLDAFQAVADAAVATPTEAIRQGVVDNPLTAREAPLGEVPAGVRKPSQENPVAAPAVDATKPSPEAPPVAPGPKAETITGSSNERTGSEMPAEREERPTSAGRKQRRKTVFGEERPWDLIDAIEEAYGKIDLAAVRRLVPDYKPTGAARRLFRSGSGHGWDQVAQSMANDKIFKGDPGSIDDFLGAVDQASSGRQANRELSAKRNRQDIAEGRQRSQFETKVLEGKRPKKEAGRVEVVPVSDLLPGDTFEVQGSKFRVQDMEWDPDTDQLLSVTLKDGPKFGVQRIEGDQSEVIHVDRDSLMRREGATDFLSPEDAAASEPSPPPRPQSEPFNLESVTEQQLKAEAIAQQEAAAAAARREEMAQRQAAPLTGDSSDVGQGALFDEGADLFSGPSAESRSNGDVQAQQRAALYARLTALRSSHGSLQRVGANLRTGSPGAGSGYTPEQRAAMMADLRKQMDAVRAEIAALDEQQTTGAQSMGRTQGAEATTAQAYPGGPLGEAPPKPADNRGFTRFPMELPEAVKFARDLAGGAYPRLRERLRLLGGRALGVFRHNDAHGKASIEMRRDLFDLPESERARLRDEAKQYAEVAGKTPEEVARIAAERYDWLKREAFKENPLMALKILWHEIGHWVDWVPDHMIQGRGNLFGRLASLKRYLRHTLPEGPDVPDRPITPKEREALKKEAEAELRKEMGPMEEIVRTIWIDEPQYRVAGVTAEDVKRLLGMDARESMPDLYLWFAGQSGDVKRDILRAAMKGMVDERVAALGKREQVGTKRVWRTERQTVGREPTREEIMARLKEKLRAEMRKRRMVELKQLKAEIEPMIAWWRGTDTMEPYFAKSSEMYAEAFSIFANNPAALAQRAPTYYRVLTNYLSQKPEVAKLYREIQDSIGAGTIMRDRVEDLRRSWRVDDEQSMERARNRERLTSRDWLDNVLYHMDDRLGPVYQVARKSGARRPPPPSDMGSLGARYAAPLNAGERLREAAGNYRYRATEHERLLSRINREVVEPLADAGVDRVMLAEYMFHKHVVESRYVRDAETGELRMIGNPMGWAPKNSLDRLAEMKTQLGADGFARVEAAQKRFRQIYEEQVVDLIQRSGMASPELMQALEERTFYATFQAVKGEVKDGIEQLLEERYGAGVGSKIYRQVGNLGEIKNPLTATTLKAMSLTSAAYRNIVKRETVSAMLEHDQANIREADVRWTGDRMEPVIVETPKLGTLVYLEQGRPRAYYVPKGVADAINGKPAVENLLALSAIKSMSWMKAIFTQLNYGFWPVAFVKDAIAWQMQLPGAGPAQYAKRIGPALKAAYDAWGGRRANPLADEALRRQMMITRADTRGVLGAAGDEFDLAIASYGLDLVKWGEAERKGTALVRLWNAYRELGQVAERAQKIAGMTHLDAKFPDMPEWQKQELVRERAGSPDFLRRGSASPLVDWAMMFFNPWKEGLRSVAKTARDNPFSFGSKVLGAVITPAVLQSLATKGAMGPELEEMYGSVSDYDLTNYLVIPLGWHDRERKKVAYIRLPLWEPARIMHGAVFQGMTGRGQGILSQAGGQIPGINPLLTTAAMWATYLGGKNPYDSFRGREVLSPDVFAVGGAPAAAAMLRQTWNNLGGALITQLQERPIGEPEPERVEAFLRLPVVSNALGRWVKVSNRGVFDRDRKAAQPAAVEAATRREVVRGVVEKIMADPPQALTDSERVIMRHPDAQRYFYELRLKTAQSRNSLQQQRLQRLPSKAQKAAAMNATP